MQIQTSLTSARLRIHGGGKKIIIPPQSVTGAERMVEVAAKGGKTKVFPSDAGVKKAGGEFRILLTPADKIFVKAVDLDKVLAPYREVAGANSLDSLFSSAAQLGEKRRTDQVLAVAYSGRQQPRPVTITIKRLPSCHPPENHSADLNEMPSARRGTVIFNEAIVQQNIVINHD